MSQTANTERTSFFTQLAGFCALGAGVVHAGAVGIHAEHPATARTFVVLSLLQVATGLAVLLGPSTWWKRFGIIAVNAAAIGGWVLTRTTGISWINGLEVAESPQTADLLCAALAALAVAGCAWPLVAKTRAARPTQPMFVASVAAVLTVPALWSGATHVHSHVDGPLETEFQIGADGVIIFTGTSTTVASATSTTVGSGEAISGDDADGGSGTSSNSKPSRTTVAPAPTSTTQPPAAHTHSTTPEQRMAAQSGWPRPFNPASGPDFDGVAGVTDVQFARARTIITETARDLAKYATTAAAAADGYKSIGDSITGYEHWIKWELIPDGRVLDSKAPESLVYKVDGPSRTLVSAMYMAQPGTAINDPTLVSYAGPLMQWHVHDNLCFLGGRVVGLVAPGQSCAIGSNNSALSPMVHVWIAPHPCGPFAAVEGVAAGVAQASDEERLDLCNRH